MTRLAQNAVTLKQFPRWTPGIPPGAYVLSENSG
jgi:hypothetical protein